MKVIRNGVGWDIAFDMIFTDKQTAAIIARRIAPLLPTLIRDAVDASMLDQAPRGIVAEREHPNTSTRTSDLSAKESPRIDHKAAREVFRHVYAAASIVSRVEAMGISVASAAE
jgi:hypothetical protein